MRRVMSLFSGIGGFDVGLERAGYTVVAQVENDPFCQRVLGRRWPGVERFGDVREFRGPMGRAANGHCPDAQGDAIHAPGRQSVDLLVGGFPCQDLSVAGKRAGLRGARSSLFHEFVRIAQAIRPTFGFVENVPGLVSSHRGRDLWTVLQGLRQCWPAVGWRVLDSQHFGVPQRRRRLFLVGGPTVEGVAEVLALTESGGGDPAARGEARANLTARTGKGPDSDCTDGQLIIGPLGGGNDGIGRRSEVDPNLVITFQNTGHGWWNQSPMASPIRTPDGGGSMEANLVTHALVGEGHDASEDGTGRGTPLVIAPTLRGGGAGGTSHGKPSGSDHRPLVQGSASIRRLTPLECERLQGFPDGWTCLCTALAAYADDPNGAALKCTCPDSPRYRALGNAVTVPVIAWLGRRFFEANP